MSDPLFDTPTPEQTPARAGGTHECAAPGCHKQLPARLLMCSADWRRVPWAIRQRIYTLYRAGQTALTASEEYLAAVKDAIAAVEGRTT